MESFYSKYGKRMLDIFLGSLGVIIFFVSFLFVAPLIYFNDKGSILYRSKRRGKGDKVFIMYKYRSMSVNAPDIRNEDNTTFNSANDPRVTKIGKFLRETSLDEIPQFLNVLKGDMSIIGPRPNIPTEGLAYEDIPEEKRKRLRVRSGITGYSQAYYRNSLPVAEKIKADNYYVDNLSFKLDLKIFFVTIKRMLTRKDVYIK